jgi:Na+-transporting NADH:ubiquinone oxidoreductase subunit NqrC
MFAQCADGAFPVHGVPENDGCHNQVETARSIALVLEAAVAQVALPVEEHGVGESVHGFAVIEADLDTPAQLRVLHPLQHEKRALDATDFTKRGVEAELAPLHTAGIHMREGRWVIADLRGKEGRIRTVAVPVWVKQGIDAWSSAAGLEQGGYCAPSARAAGSARA